MMRVAYVIDNMHETGGAQQAATRLAELTAADSGRDVSIFVLHPDAGGRYIRRLNDAGIEVHHFGAKRLFDRTRVHRMADAMRHGRFDVVHTNLVYANIVGTFAARRAEVPVLAGLRSVYGAESMKDRARFLIEAQVIRRLADGAMAVGPRTASWHQQRLAPVHVASVPNSVALAELDDGFRMASRRQLGVENSLLIVAVGGLRPAKGFDTFVDALSMLSDRAPVSDTPIRVLVAGEGVSRSALQRQIDAAGLSTTVTLLGAVHPVTELLAAADVFVSSSRREGLSNAILEAMAAGVACVVTDVGDSAGAIGDAGLVVEADDVRALALAVEDLLTSPSRREALGRAARERVRDHYDPQQWVDSMFDLYDTLTS